MNIFAKRTERMKLKKIRPNQHLKNCLRIFHYVGTWPGNTKYKYLYIVYAIFIMGFLLGVTLVTEFAYLIVNRRDTEIMMAGAALFMTNVMLTAKVVCIVFRHKHIRNLLDVTNNEMFNRDNEKHENIVMYYTRRGIFHHVLFQVASFITVISWGCTPIVQIYSTKSKELPTEGWFPYNVTNTPMFEITSSYQFFVVFIGCINNVAIDVFITGLMVTTCCQLTLLNTNISSIYAAEKEVIASTKKIDSNSVHRTSNLNHLYNDLKRCIEHSIMIYDFSKQIQDVFGTVTFFQLLSNCIIICLAAFKISQMQDYVALELIGMTMYLFSMIYQIFIYCWHGNELYLHSTDICLSAYSNNWWDNSKKFKQALIIIMARSQSPIIITAGNIMELSLQNFVLILRTSYSIFTVLKTTTA